MVKGFIEQKEVTLINVYVPPGQETSCIREIFNLIATEATGVLICGGDWNTQLQCRLDSSNTSKRPSPNARVIKGMLSELGMINVWRELNPTARQYTFYSASHRVHSRIDYFFTSNLDRHRLRECSIGIRDVSDHSPVYLTLHLDIKKKNTYWRLNTSILYDSTCKNYIIKEFKDYMDNNNNGEVSPSVL